MLRRRGGDDGFQEFAVAGTPHLFRTALLLCGDYHRAEDLVQDTLAKLCVAWHRVDRDGNPTAYARTVLLRTFLSQQRRKASTELPMADLPDPGRHADDGAALRVTLLEAMIRLSARDRAVLVLRYWEDRSVEESAEILGMKAPAVRTQSRRALARLREQLGEVFPELLAG